jgi:hypothetical protein
MKPNFLNFPLLKLSTAERQGYKLQRLLLLSSLLKDSSVIRDCITIGIMADLMHKVVHCTFSLVSYIFSEFE